MSFIEGIRDKTGGKKGEMSFIRDIKDKRRENQKRNVFYMSHEEQNR